MVAVRIPGTDRIVFLPEHSGDHVIDMGNFPDVDTSIRQEDVRVVGDWVDYAGSGTKYKGEVMMQGVNVPNPESLTAEIEQTEVEVTDRGNIASNHRQRNRLILIETK